jgi:hypothetical protein
MPWTRRRQVPFASPRVSYAILSMESVFVLGRRFSPASAEPGTARRAVSGLPSIGRAGASAAEPLCPSKDVPLLLIEKHLALARVRSVGTRVNQKRTDLRHWPLHLRVLHSGGVPDRSSGAIWRLAGTRTVATRLFGGQKYTYARMGVLPPCHGIGRAAEKILAQIEHRVFFVILAKNAVAQARSATHGPSIMTRIAVIHYRTAGPGSRLCTVDGGFSDAVVDQRRQDYSRCVRLDESITKLRTLVHRRKSSNPRLSRCAQGGCR